MSQRPDRDMTLRAGVSERTMRRAPVQVVLVAGKQGWNPTSVTASVMLVFVVLIVVAVSVFVAFGLHPAPAMKVFAGAFLALLVLLGWAFVAQLAVTHRRILRMRVHGSRVSFRGPDAVGLPVRLVPFGALLLAGAWVWIVVSVPAQDLTRLTLFGPPLVALLALVATVPSWWRAPSHELVLQPEGLTVRMPGSRVHSGWDQISDAVREAKHVVVRTRGGARARWAFRDLASDPQLLADLISFYAQNPPARAEIGEATVERVRRGEF